MTIGTRLLTWFCGERVGTDQFGNRSGEARSTSASIRIAFSPSGRIALDWSQSFLPTKCGPYGKAYFLKVAHKTTNLACINTTKLKAYRVLLPTLDEQRGIVTIFDAIDRKIELHRKKRPFRHIRT
jgi:hypothetical protein